MAMFAWRRRATRHFGEQLVPFAELSLKDAAGRWRSFSVQVDTGATISVAPRSVGQLLGLLPSEAETIDLAGVAAPPQTYHVHRLSARLGDLPDFDLRIAIADREDVPTLLGRLDILFRFRIAFEPFEEATIFKVT